MSINWLPLSHRKNISQLKIIYEPKHYNYSGYYIPGAGTIVVVENEDEKNMVSTMAHEFRHHIQYETRSVPMKIVQFNHVIDYDNAIRKYFRSSLSELDALIYQQKYATTEMVEWWLKELVDDQGFRKRYF